MDRTELIRGGRLFARRRDERCRRMPERKKRGRPSCLSETGNKKSGAAALSVEDGQQKKAGRPLCLSEMGAGKSGDGLTRRERIGA